MALESVRRHPHSQRGARDPRAGERAHHDADRVGTLLRDHRRGRWQHRRELRDPGPAPGRGSASARHPVPPQLRADRGVRRRVRARPGPPDRHLRRRPPERSARHPVDGRVDRTGLRHRLRLAEGPEGHAVAAGAVDAGEPADFGRHARAAARLRVLAEGVPRRSDQAAEAVRRDAPVPAGHRERAGRRDQGSRGQPPGAEVRRVRSTGSRGPCASSSIW